MSQQEFYETVQRQEEYMENYQELSQQLDAHHKQKFSDIYQTNVNDKTEARDGLTYLSWAWAWAEFKKHFPRASYEVVKNEQGLPYFESDIGAMVYTRVWADNVEHEMWLPVMNSTNKAMRKEAYTYTTKGGDRRVEAYTMFDINKTIMRCLVKNLAMFGLGLYIYAGEDLPDVEIDITSIVKRVTDSKNMDELKANYKQALIECGSDNNAKNAVIKATNEMKSLFDQPTVSEGA